MTDESKPAPPSDFDFRVASKTSTNTFVQKRCPELRPLVEQGVLLVISRPEGYVERRKDGYQEPEHIVLVGTAHVSQKSADAVTEVVQALQPDSVVVELCRSRSAVLQGDPAAEGEAHDREQHGPDSAASLPTQQQPQKPNPLGLSGGNLGEALMRSVRLGGGTQVLIRAIMAGQVKKATASMGLATGAEMQAARAAAEEVGANIVLGDRPIEMTLQRAWRALTWQQKARLGWEGLKLAASNLQVDEETVESLKDDNMAATFEATLSREFPKLAGPLLHERDAYLAWCLRRSKAVNHASVVVGVMGFGHLRGVTYHLLQDGQQLRFKDLW
ncbi:hypothetical protein WJX73_007300 [Symbiochloris irregularis]|uniref:TraB domain-containing protein n=1 Tax=Symbiochloris irregularis TaxID=706552 RepID=A0AAW1NVS6_9CHLO